MPWIENDESNAVLYEELHKLSHERGALERLVGAINEDETAKALDEARRGEKHQSRKALLVTTTLTRWLDGGLEKLKTAQPHKKRLVFEFLERSEAFPTAIYAPPNIVPDEIAAFFQQRKKRHAELRLNGLSYLDGRYDLFERTEDKVVLSVSTLTIQTIAGVTCFAEQPHVADRSAPPDTSRAPMKGVAFSNMAGTSMIGIRAFDLSIFSVADSSSKQSAAGEVRYIRGSVQMIGNTDQLAPRKFIAESQNFTLPGRNPAMVEFASQEVKDWLNLD